MKTIWCAPWALIVVWALAGCGSEVLQPVATATAAATAPSTGTTSGDGAGPAPAPDVLAGAGGGQATCWQGSGPSLVADEVVAGLWAWDTRSDAWPADAAIRVGDHLSAQLLAQYTTSGSVDAAWMELAEHQGRVVASVQDIDALLDLPVDSELSAVRGRGVRLSPIADDGWVGPEQYVVATVYLSRAACTDPWVVDEIETSWATTTTGDLDAG